MATNHHPRSLPPSDPGALLTVGEAAALLAVSEKTVRRMIDRRDLPWVQVGGSKRIRRGDLDTWVASNTVPALRRLS